MYGEDNELLERGAFELIRLQGLLASFFLPARLAELVSEVSDIAVAGHIEPSENLYDFSPLDKVFLEALGRYGFQSDQYNEETLSTSYLPDLTLGTEIGYFSVAQIINWTVSDET